MADLFGRFERDMIAHEDQRQAAEDRRRITVWTAHLGSDREMESVDRALLDRFVRARRAGTLTVPGVKLSAQADRPHDRRRPRVSPPGLQLGDERDPRERATAPRATPAHAIRHPDEPQSPPARGDL